jgi:hypothetical protein
MAVEEPDGTTVRFSLSVARLMTTSRLYLWRARQFTRKDGILC